MPTRIEGQVISSEETYNIILIDKEEAQIKGSEQRIENCLAEDPSNECAEVLGPHRPELWEVRGNKEDNFLFISTCFDIWCKYLQTVKFSLDPLNEDKDGKEYLPNTYREVVSKTFVTETKDVATNTDPLPQVCIHFIGTGLVIFLTVTFSNCRKSL